jgi:hypothetical protein
LFFAIAFQGWSEKESISSLCESGVTVPVSISSSLFMAKLIDSSSVTSEVTRYGSSRLSQMVSARMARLLGSRPEAASKLSCSFQEKILQNTLTARY